MIKNMLGHLEMRQQQTRKDRTNDLEMFVNAIRYVFMDTCCDNLYTCGGKDDVM